MTKFSHFLLLPHLHVQNANAISSQLTHGFPSLTAFLGLMWALDRKCNKAGIATEFQAVGVVCHEYKEWRTGQNFHRVKQPAEKADQTPSIQEEGRMNMNISLLFALDAPEDQSEEILSAKILEIVSTMRVAGGTIIPRAWGKAHQESKRKPILFKENEFRIDWKKYRRYLMPGFSLVEREDALKERFRDLAEYMENPNKVDALLSLCGVALAADKAEEEIILKRPRGYFVPISIGYGVLGENPVAGLAGGRDATTPLCSVEAEYSVGEWRWPYKLACPEEMLWRSENNLEKGVFRCRNLKEISVNEGEK